MSKVNFEELFNRFSGIYAKAAAQLLGSLTMRILAKFTSFPLNFTLSPHGGVLVPNLCQELARFFFKVRESVLSHNFELSRLFVEPSL